MPRMTRQFKFGLGRQLSFDTSMRLNLVPVAGTDWSDGCVTGRKGGSLPMWIGLHVAPRRGVIGRFLRLEF
jgi:hypothetical protein